MSRRHLPLQALRSFEATARHLSMKLAAEELGVTSGAISQQIRSLESNLHVQLFFREHRQLRLSPEGEQLFRTLLRNFTEMEQALDSITSGPGSRKIRLKLVPSLAIRWLVPRLAAFHGLHPELDVEVATGTPMESSNNDDIDFTSQVGEGNWPGMTAIRLFPDAFLPVCSAAIAQSINHPADLLRWPLLHSMMRMEAWEVWLAHHGLTAQYPAGTIRFANAALAYEAAAEGLGVAMAQYAYVATDLANGKLHTPFPEPVSTSSSYFLVSSNHKAVLPKNRAFADWVRGLTVGG